MSGTKPYEVQDFEVSGRGGSLRLRARCVGPENSELWTRAWLSNQRGTLSEAEFGPIPAGTTAEIEVPIPQDLDPLSEYLVAFRVESSPLQTEDVAFVSIDWPDLMHYRSEGSPGQDD